MRNQAHPRERKSWEVSGLQGAKCIAGSGISLEAIEGGRETIPDRNEQLEVRGAEARLNGVQIVDQAREKSEERFLLECLSLLLVHIGQHKDKNG